MKASLTLGYFGPTKIYSILGKPVAMRVRQRNRVEFHILLDKGKKSFPIFALPLSKKYREADQFNCSVLERLNSKATAGSDSDVLRQIARARTDGKTIVLYVLDYLAEAGGVERRLALQFAWLERHGVQPVFVCEKHNYAPLAGVPTILIAMGAPNASETLLEIVKLTQVDVVEFQMKSPRFLHSIDLAALKAIARVGCMVHGIVDAEEDVLEQLDYRATSTTHANDYAGFVTIPNVVDFPSTSSIPKFDPHAAKALYVGRIDAEKLPTLRNFVKLCERYGVAFEIAGPLSGQEEVVAFMESIPRNRSLGTIDTRFFLEKHGNEYLFVAGVGQVPLEAAAVNLPALVAAHATDFGRSTFLTTANLRDLREWNCVIKDRKIPRDLAPGNAEEFFAAVSAARAADSDKALDRFRVRSALEKQLSADAVWGRYLKLGKGER